MFFGLTNSPATFQTMMNHYLYDLIQGGRVVVYMDDILIFTRTKKEHIAVVRAVLERLQKHHLFLKPEKCLFHQTEIPYLGLIISENALRTDPVKIEGIAKWPVPKKKKDVQSFLGFANFYRRFIKDYAKVAHPLHHLTGKHEWKWGKEEQESFEH